MRNQIFQQKQYSVGRATSASPTGIRHLSPNATFKRGRSPTPRLVPYGHVMERGSHVSSIRKKLMSKVEEKTKAATEKAESAASFAL